MQIRIQNLCTVSRRNLKQDRYLIAGVLIVYNIGGFHFVSFYFNSLDRTEITYSGDKEDKIIDVIGSDHAPHTIEEKKQKYPKSPSGMTGVQTLLPIMLNFVNEKK